MNRSGISGFLRAYGKSMRIYYSFVTGIAGWVGVAHYQFIATHVGERGTYGLVRTIEVPASLTKQIIILLILWGFDTFRTRKRKRYDPAIEAADASERYQWRYLRWGFRIIQVVAGVYIVVQLIQVLLR